jgi:hypothetical protein
MSAPCKKKSRFSGVNSENRVKSTCCWSASVAEKSVLKVNDVDIAGVGLTATRHVHVNVTP